MVRVQPELDRKLLLKFALRFAVIYRCKSWLSLPGSIFLSELESVVNSFKPEKKKPHLPLPSAKASNKGRNRKKEKKQQLM